MHMVFARICQNSKDFEATFFHLSKEFGTAFYIEDYSDSDGSIQQTLKTLARFRIRRDVCEWCVYFRFQ